MKRATLVPLARVLAADATLAGWNERRTREQAVLAVVRKVLPRPVGQRVRVASADGGTLELAAPTGAIASVVRQRGPDILARLAHEGWEFSGMRLRVQPHSAPPETNKQLPRQWDSASLRPLAALEAGLPASPLKTALARFLRGR